MHLHITTEVFNSCFVMRYLNIIKLLKTYILQLVTVEHETKSIKDIFQ